MITCGFLPIFIELSTNCPQIRTVIHNFGQMTCIMVSPYSDTLSSLLVCPCFRLPVRLIGPPLFPAPCPAYWSAPVSGSLSGLLVCPCFRLPVRLIGLSLFPAPCPAYWSVPVPTHCPAYWSVPVSGSLSNLLTCPISKPISTSFPAKFTS